jgi:gamma-glutamylcyclotransferase (GGCT)/AIG2-like uncharacterized protein YtfP
VQPISARLHQANSTNSGQTDQLSGGTSKLFVYGTLLLDDIVKSLIDRVPHHNQAIAHGWRIVCLPQKIYPGLVPGDGGATGKLFIDLTNTEWALLDAFEDPDYRLTPLTVSTPLETNALAYVWQGEHTNQPWARAKFESQDLTDYLNRCRTWRHRYEGYGR